MSASPRLKRSLELLRAVNGLRLWVAYAEKGHAVPIVNLSQESREAEDRLSLHDGGADLRQLSIYDGLERLRQ